MTTLKDYPSFTNKDTISDDLRRIAQLRHEDDDIITRLFASVSYKQAHYPNVREVSAATSFGKFDYHIEVDATSSPLTVTLPNDSNIACRQVVVSKKDASGNAVTISGGGKNINGSATTTAATQYAFKRLHYLPTAGEWRII